MYQVTIRSLTNKFKATGLVLDLKTPVQNRGARANEDLERVNKHVLENHNLSRFPAIEHFQKLLTKDFDERSDSIRLQTLVNPRTAICRSQTPPCVYPTVDVEFYNKIIFSDEVHFHIGGYINCKIWGRERPRVIEEQRIHPLRIFLKLRLKKQLLSMANAISVCR
ncbi:hypothetical protein ILUMI_00165 [Ignelater luminosus]|uniref:Uncharacterized protein n=1 Tax=Ignelater luminosus TaxID=2038154 RepID=A0A8K0GLI3_IGNLU|nr:hypothetical protein ILUMI_00165 [Ignelater luminosus]